MWAEAKDILGNLNMKRAFIILFSPLFLLLITSGLKPTIISSRQLLEHRKRGYHPECPERLSGILDLLESNSMVNLIEPSAIGSDERLKLAENAIEECTVLNMSMK